jgi:ATP/maltotriose-dependent transcriptional regulator MalT
VYCNYKEQDQTAVNLVSSLLLQLVEQQTVIPESVIALYESHTARKTRPSVVEISALLNAVASQFSMIYVVIDALDECSERDRSRDIFLNVLKALPSNVQLLITSRNIPDVERRFEDLARLDILAADGDVRKYLESKIQQYPRLVSYTKKDASFKSGIIDKIVERTHGM